MIVLDSTVLIDLLRDRTGKARAHLDARIGAQAIAFTRMTQFEVMRACRDQRQWERMGRYFDAHPFLEAGNQTWHGAARIVFDLKRKGKTISSTIDCVIAQIVIENERLILHNDADFEAIATIRPLRQERIDIKALR